MAFTTSNPVSVDEATKADDYDVVFDNTIALSQCRLSHEMGGNPYTAYTDTSYVTLRDFQIAYIDGTNLSGFIAYFGVMVVVASGTGYVRLWNANLGAAVAGSEITFTNTSVAYTTASITLASGASTNYYAQIKGSTAAALPRVWGAKIVCRS